MEMDKSISIGISIGISIVESMAALSRARAAPLPPLTPCLRLHPHAAALQKHQGLLWVWPESSAEAKLLAASPAHMPPTLPHLDAPGRSAWYGLAFAPVEDHEHVS